MLLTPLAPTFDAALRDVGARDPRFRLAAAESLCSPPEGREAEAAAALRRLADDALGPVRQAAVAGLGMLGDAEASELLHARFDDGHLEVRQAAVTAAAQVDTDRTWLLALLSDPRPEMRFQAVRALAAHLPERGEALVPVLADDDVRVASSAARAIGELGLDSARDALAAQLTREDVAFAAAVALADLGDGRGEPELVRSLGRRALVFEAVEALGLVASPAAVEALHAHAARLFAPLLLRAAIGAALARRGDGRGEPVLARVLSAWRPDGRDYAVHAAGELRLEGLLPLLVGLARRLRGADPRTLARTLRAFDRAEAKEALALLTRRFGDALESAS